MTKSAGLHIPVGIDMQIAVSAAHTAKAGQRVGGGGHGENSKIRILHGAQLTLQQNGFACLQRVMDKPDRVAHIGTDCFPQGQQLLHQVVGVQRGFVVKMFEQDVF
ncbi:hypothetical protein SDC9_176166 [bioreactor metagenome]|uniref:Uncharacterized protein n=1 Tax=bioreactor metagenome TaxID=1076179 RepID=A0A645GP83_9ZZZZ